MRKEENTSFVEIGAIDIITASWETLELATRRIHRERPSHPIWYLRETKPFNPSSPDQLFQDGWSVKLKEGGFACVMRRKKLIEVNVSQGGYARDKGLFHELCHAWYGEVLDDTIYFPSRESMENGIIAEWLARQLRAKPDLLRRAILGFGLQPKLYDKTSLLAFPELFAGMEYQLPLSFNEDFRCVQKNLKKVLMD